jgi:hypothetical protein
MNFGWLTSGFSLSISMLHEQHVKAQSFSWPQHFVPDSPHMFLLLSIFSPMFYPV